MKQLPPSKLGKWLGLGFQQIVPGSSVDAHFTSLRINQHQRSNSSWPVLEIRNRFGEIGRNLLERAIELLILLISADIGD